MLVLEINVDGMFAAAAVGCATTKKKEVDLWVEDRLCKGERNGWLASIPLAGFRTRRCIPMNKENRLSYLNINPE